MAVELAELFDKPLVAYAHNLAYLEGHPELEPERHVLLANTEAMLERLEWAGRSLVLRPPVFYDDWAGDPGELVTHVNLSQLKGGRLFWDLARAELERDFLAVVGGWGEQIAGDGSTHGIFTADRIVPKRPAPANVEVIPRTLEMLRDVYRRTRVLLVPTARVNANQVGESYGLVAAEALCSGIPVIARRSPGLEELAGDAARFVDSDRLEEWGSALAELDDPAVYAEASARARARARDALDPTAELEALEELLLELAERTLLRAS